MKKWLTIIAVASLVLFGSPSSAAEVSIQPTVSHHMFSDLDNAVGVGAKVIVDNAFIDNLRLSGSIERIESETTLPGLVPINVDLDMFVTSLEVGYIFDISEKLKVIPNVGIDYWSISGDNFVDADNEIGFHFGGSAEYQANERVAFNVGVKAMFGETDLSAPPLLGGGEVDLDNIAVTAGINIKF